MKKYKIPHVRVDEEYLEQEFKPLSKMLDKQIRNAKKVNTTKATKIKTAMEELNILLDSDIKRR